MYLIWSNEHRGWWGPGHSGYVQRVSQAGIYSREQAIAICKNALGTALHLRMLAELPVRVDDVRLFLDGDIVPEHLL